MYGDRNDSPKFNVGIVKGSNNARGFMCHFFPLLSLVTNARREHCLLLGGRGRGVRDKASGKGTQNQLAVLQSGRKMGQNVGRVYLHRLSIKWCWWGSEAPCPPTHELAGHSKDSLL